MMKNYLSFGGGVNSVAMMLLLLDEGVEFEAINVWMLELPETHEYMMMLENKGIHTNIIFPCINSVNGPLGPVPGKYANLYEYCYDRHIVPSWSHKWCSIRFKKETLQKYQTAPAWVLIGYANDEKKRANLNSEKGFEHRYPLIEREISRKKCKEIIRHYGFEVPVKSGCYFCPHQSDRKWKKLRRDHPDLFCKAVQLEARSLEVSTIKNGKKMYLNKYNIPLEKLVMTNQKFLFPELSYEPCNCGL